MHHLMLDVTQEMGTLAQADGLADGEGVEGHPDPAGAGPSVLEDDVVGLVALGDPLNAARELSVVVVDGSHDGLPLGLIEVCSNLVRNLALRPGESCGPESVPQQVIVWDGVTQLLSLLSLNIFICNVFK